MHSLPPYVYDILNAGYARARSLRIGMREMARVGDAREVDFLS